MSQIADDPSTRKRRKCPPEGPVPRVALHFGVRVQTGSRHGLRIDRDAYAHVNKRSSSSLKREDVPPETWDWLGEDYEDEEHRIHTDAWCARQRADALENFDLNMAYFASLDHAEFDQAVTIAVESQRGMVEVTDLNDWDSSGGLYVMVLDDYCQAYVGVTESMDGVKGRIRQHWSSSKAFDRLLFGGVKDSILSIDSFRALDTTRIFAAKVRNPYSLEDKVIDAFPGRFLLNRLMGGRGDLLGFAQSLGVDIMKTRPLDPTE